MEMSKGCLCGIKEQKWAVQMGVGVKAAAVLSENTESFKSFLLTRHSRWGCARKRAPQNPGFRLHPFPRTGPRGGDGSSSPCLLSTSFASSPFPTPPSAHSPLLFPSVWKRLLRALFLLSLEAISVPNPCSGLQCPPLVCGRSQD